jgi:PAS domain S-box-containing protein
VIAFGGLAALGRTTVVGPDGTALVWPAAGAAVVWLALVPKATWPVHLVALALVSALVNGLTGATQWQVVTFAASTVVQTVAAVLVLEASRPHLLAAGGSRGLRNLADLGGLCASAVAGGLVGGACAGIGLRLLGSDQWQLGAASWSGRNTAGIVGVAGLGLLLVAETGPRVPLGLDLRSIRVSAWWPRLPEALLLVATTIALYSAVFLAFGDVPIAFALLLVTAWAGGRFKPLFVQCHSLAAVSLATWFTVAGEGPFAHGLSVDVRAFLSQAFMAVLIVFGLTVALARRDRILLIRDLRQAREQLAARAALLSAVVDSMREGVTVVDDTGRVILRNSAGERILGLTGSSVTGVLDRPQRVFTFDGQVVDVAGHPWRRALETGEPVQQELFVDPGDGTERRLLRVIALPLPPTDGPRLAVVLFRDITEDRAQREALETFAEVVAHDLKSPLGGILGWLEVLQDEPGGELRTRAMSGIGAGARDMEQLISSLLTFSLATHGTVALTRIDLGALVRELCELRVVGTNGVTPSFTIGELPEVYGEPVLVRQLMDNLVGNACKYTPPGTRPEVRISAHREHGWVEVEVSDNGIGVPVQERERIFDAFHRGIATGYDGHGLGLAICKRIVERHGGEIAVRSGVGGRGSRFVLTLPGRAEGA